MSDLPMPAIEPERLADLRGRAATRLAGPAAAKGSPARAADALSVLHALASCPETASDALTLLHEMQVLQVEVDLQAQELRESRAELESALRRQIDLYDHMPVACFTIDSQRVLHEMNQTGAAMLGIARDDAYGLPFDAFFGVESARRFRLAVSGFDASTQRSPCLLTLRSKDGIERPVLASIGADPAAPRYLVTLTDAGDEQDHPQDHPGAAA